MGLSDYISEGVIREHCYRPIGRSVVQIGRQTIELAPSQLRQLIVQYKLPLNGLEGEIEIDRRTTQVRQTGASFVSDRAFFSALGATEIHAVDHSDFEGADIVHDMNTPIGPSLEAIADLVVDGSTLDNVHDAATALMNYNRMLRPGGRVHSINAAKPNVHGAYTGTSLEWYLDYYTANQYADCRVYAQLNFPTTQWSLPSGPVVILAIDYGWVLEHGRVPTLDHDGAIYAIVVAEKGPASTWDRVPTRAQFRTEAERAQWRAQIERFSASRRTSHVTTMRTDFTPPPGFILAI